MKAGLPILCSCHSVISRKGLTTHAGKDQGHLYCRDDKPDLKDKDLTSGGEKANDVVISIRNSEKTFSESGARGCWGNCGRPPQECSGMCEGLWVKDVWAERQ